MGELRVRLQPRAKRDEVVGPRGEALIVRVSAPPVDGRANVALCKLLARVLDVPPTTVAVVRGATSREKLVRVERIGSEELRRRFGLNG